MNGLGHQENISMIKCPKCQCTEIDKGRAFDGRRAYRCKSCKNEWTNGLNGRKQRYSIQRMSNQFANKN